MRIVIASLGLLLACRATRPAQESENRVNPPSVPPSSERAPVSERTIEYSFHDKSVPPQYHRSYTIRLAAGGGSIVVDVYGDTIAQETIALSADDWRDLEHLASKLPASAKRVTEGLSGGTSESLRIMQGTAESVLLEWDSQSTAGAEASALIARIKATVPRLPDLLATKYPTP
ncbi:MAG: hypothetical protein SFX73_01890 [Kofleriaceae bacterium]|nr:hypothetical protein [Kofleriaceae bacterium]